MQKENPGAMKKSKSILSLFLAPFIFNINVICQNQIRQLFYNNQYLIQVEQLPDSLKAFMDNYQQLESFNISFNVEKDKIF